MSAALPDLSRAEYGWLRPRVAADAVFQFLRSADATRPDDLLAGAPALSGERVEELHTFAGELAAQWGLTEALEEAIDRAAAGARGAWRHHAGFPGSVRGGEYRNLFGPGHSAWSDFVRRAELHTASLVVDPYLSDDERELMRLPALPVELI